RLGVGSYIINRQWGIAVAGAKGRGDSSAGARLHRGHRGVKNGGPPVLPPSLMRGTGPSCQAKNAYPLARAADWYLIQGGYDVNGQPLKGLEIRFRSEPIKRPRGVDMVHHREARAYCKDKFGVDISADTARECLREFLALERRLTGKKRV